MIPTQRLPPSLTPLEEALAALLDGLKPVAPIGLSLADALGCGLAAAVIVGGYLRHEVFRI